MQAPSAATARRWERVLAYPFGICPGELFLWLFFFCLNLYWAYYWIIDNDYLLEHKLAEKGTIHKNMAAVGRISGLQCNLLSAFVMLPVSRTGLWVDVFAIPYDRAIK